MTLLMDKPDESKEEKGKEEGENWTPKPPIKKSYSQGVVKIRSNPQKGYK